MMSRYILRFDDISEQMAWTKFLPLKKILRSLDIKCVLGVVPRNRDQNLNVESPRRDFFGLIREFRDAGDAILQHGTHHQYTTTNCGLLGINSRSEFAGHQLEVQLNLLAAGKSVLQQEGVWEPFFMAPAHSFDDNTLEALRLLGFEALSDGYGLYPYERHGIKLVPQLASRPIPLLGGIQTICVHINKCSDVEIAALAKFATENRKQILDFKRVVRERPQPEATLGRRVTEVLWRARRAMRR